MSTDRAERLCVLFRGAAYLIPPIGIAITQPFCLMLLFLSATAFHELGHILANRLMGGGWMRLSAVPFGLKLSPDRRMLSYGREGVVALSGGGANLVTAALALGIASVWREAAEGAICFSIVSLLSAGLNLLPIRPLDGGRVLEDILLMFFDPGRVDRVIEGLSVTLSASGCLLSLFLSMKGYGGLYVFCLFFCLLMTALIGGKTRIIEEKQEKTQFSTENSN